MAKIGKAQIFPSREIATLFGEASAEHQKKFPSAQQTKKSKTKKSKTKRLTSREEKDSHEAITMIREAITKHQDKPLKSKHQKKFEAEFREKMEHTFTHAKPYSPAETIIYKDDERTSVLHEAHKAALIDARLAFFENVTDALFPEEAALSNRVEAQMQEDIKIATEKAIRDDEMNRLYSTKDYDDYTNNLRFR